MKRIKTNKAEASTQINRAILNKIFANSVIQSRMSYGNTKTFNGLRDPYQALGYPQVGQISYSEYFAKYLRQDIASAIIDKPVYGAWREAPIIRTEGVDEEQDSFKQAWDELNNKFKLINMFQRLDKLAGLGKYAVLYFGVQDGSQEAGEELIRASKLLYIQPYSEDNAPIKAMDMDRTSERYALPETYGLKTVTISGGQVDYNSTNETRVHHSRLLHVADNLLENNVFGIPRLEKIYNRLLNLELIVGGSAEMFWQGAFPGLAFNVQEGYELGEPELTALEEEIKKYVHNMERYMKLNGIDVNNLSSQVVDPLNHIEAQLKMISIATGIPKRILEGSERGELASSQDTKAWNNYCDNRRTTFCEHEILRPTVDKLIDIQVLPEPQGGEYTVEWPDLDAPSDKDKAEVGKIRSEAIRSYTATPDAQLLFPLRSYLTDILDMSPEKIERIMQESEENYLEMLKQESEGESTEEEDMEILDSESN